jgi:O-antigen/teichoic acid export membrane protein
VGGSERAGSLARDGAIAGISSLVLNAATFVFYAAGVRSLGVESGGLLLALIAAVLLGSAPFSVAALAVGTTAARYHARAQPAELARLAGNAILAFGALGIVVIAAAEAASAPIVAFFGGGDRTAMVAAAAALTCTAFLYILRGLLQGISDYAGLGLSNGLEALCRVALSVLFLLHHVTIDLALGGLVVALGASALVSLILLLKRTGASFVMPQAVRLNQSGNGPILATMGVLMFLSFFDAIIARHFLSPTQSGLYNAAALAGRGLTTLLAFVPSMIMPKLAAAEELGTDSRTLVIQVAAITLGICVLAAGIFWLEPRLLIVIIAGQKFAAAASLVARYGIAASALAGSSVICSLRLGRSDHAMTPAVVCAAVAEAVALLLYHSSAETLVLVVVIGHSAILVAALIPWRSAITRTQPSARRNPAG